jgi:hypothetical protein
MQADSMIGDNPEGSTLRAVALILLLLGSACSPQRRGSTPAEIDVPPGRSLVFGRIQLYKGGQPLHVGPAERPMFGWIEGARPLTTLTFRNLDTNDIYHVEIERDDGWFETTLPPGLYGVGLRYYIYLSGSPVRLDVSEAAARCYIGTLHVNFFAHQSAGGAWATTFGGVVFEADTDFSVSNDWNTAPTRSPMDGAVTEDHLMRLQTIERSKSHQPEP